MDSSNSAFPTNTQKALRHLNMIENNKTPVLAVFCISSTAASLKEITKAYRRLAALVHPDRCHVDPRGANRSMRTLARAMEIVQANLEYQRSCKGLETKDEFKLKLSTKYSLQETYIEEILRDREARQGTDQRGESPEERQFRTSDREDEDRAERERSEEKRKREEKESEERARAEQIRKMRADRERNAGETSHVGDIEPEQASAAAGCGGSDLDDKRDSDSDSDIELSSKMYPEELNSEDDDDDEDDDSNVLEISNYSPADYVIFDNGNFPNDDNVLCDDTLSSQGGDEANTADVQGDSEGVGEMHGDSERDKNTSRNVTGSFRRAHRSAYQLRRIQQKRASKRRTMERARLALQAEKVGAMTWRPRRSVEITPFVGMALQFRWQCDQIIRAHTAYVGVHKGVNISQTWEKVRMKCRNEACSACMTFNWQPSTGLWKMNQYIPHCDDCTSHDEQRTASGSQIKSFCAPAYTPHQVARAILNEAAVDPSISARTIGSLVRAKQIYRRQPPDSHYRSVRVEILRHMSASRAVDMAAIEV